MRNLRATWLESLSKKYGYVREDNNQIVDKSVANLDKIYTLFVNSEQSDPKFANQILNGKGRQYEQALSEMLFWDVLKKSLFNLSCNNGKGPDFHFTINDLNVYCEVVTPEVDAAGVVDEFNNDINTRVVAGAKRTIEHDKEIFLKITSVLKDKQQKYIRYKEKGIIPEDAICIIVVNDALLISSDLPMFGVSHSADWGSPPYIARSTLIKDKGLINKNNQLVRTDGFVSGGLSHISAVIQVTLRDDYGYALSLIELEGEEFCRISGMVKDFDIVVNESSRSKLPKFIFKMNHWGLDDNGDLQVQKVVGAPTFTDFAKHFNLQRKMFGLEEIPQDQLIAQLRGQFGHPSSAAAD